WSEKTHTFYFVKDYPQKYKWIWDHTRPESVLGQTNALLKSVGSKLRFEIYDYNHDGVEREFGDLRYSFINFIEEIEAGGTPLGYGPSDANPFTGEILAANVMVWTGMLDFYLEIINDAGIAAEGESSLFRQLNAALKVNGNDEVDVEQMITDWDQTQGVGKFFKHMAQHTRYAYPGWNTYTMSQAGDVLVPTVVDKYQDGTFGVGSSSSNKVGLITSVLDLPVSKLPFDFETRMLSGRPQVKVRNPYDILDISWLERAANSNSVLAQNSGMYNFIHVLNNLRKISDRNYTGKDGLKNIAQDHYERELAIIKTNEQGHCIMDAEEFFGGFGSFLKATKLDVTDPEVRADILNNILYRVSIHEFGHNLNLRHNFYGSVDKANFTINTDSSIANFPGSNRLTKYTVTGEGAYKPVSGESRQQVSSSVMDYLRLEDELNTPWAWEEYDVATILDSYQPTKFDDKGHLYLFCTDEHTATSALCNRHDFGTTPSQILMSQIRSYDERYEMRNKRYGRAFWDTSGYVGGIFGTMLSMKEFLPMWRSAFAEDIVFKQLEVMGIKNKNEQKAYLEELNREMRKVMKITMAFYQAVIQQSRGDRDYRSEYDETTGALKQMGIISDKIYAMFFLAGDDAIFYNPNLVMLHNSFLTYSKEPGLAQFTDRIWRNMVTDRNIAMEPWFINFARFQYAKNATNYNNRDAANLINAMKIVRIENAKDLKDQYGVTMDVAQPAVRTRLPKSTTGTFNKGDDVVVVHVDGSYYMTSVAEGHVTFALFQDALDKIQGSGDDDQSITQFNMDVREFFWLYNLAQSGSLQ
ncbi:MAG: hypothetical protein KDD33_09900, partial [Bdellovibrionales bacterium]|nr:hypothetical protein [Bdellovibrionales bacterium]